MIDELFQLPPYGTPEPVRQERLLSAMNAAYRHHVQNCQGYRRFCQRRGFGLEHIFSSLTEIPFLPAQAFKENGELLRSVDSREVRTKLHSSATSGAPSTVIVDAITAKRQVRALAAVISASLGSRRRPFLVLDVDPRKDEAGDLGARGAAVRGFLNLASDVHYFMHAVQDGSLSLLRDEFEEALADLHEPAIIFGFTYVLYAYAVEPLLREGRRFTMPTGSHVVHIGGWKKLIDRHVPPETFNRVITDVLGVPATNIVDFYGFTEQMGVTYPTGPTGDKHCPVFAEVIVRDPATFEPLPDGKEGLLEFLTPLPHAYPGIAVLTDDVGMITGRPSDTDAWGGTRFRVLGRAAKAEPRGCGDIMGEKMIAGPAKVVQSVVERPVQARLLWDAGENHVSGSLLAPVHTGDLPQVSDLSALAAHLKDARKVLDRYSADDRIALVGAAAQRWADPAGPLAPLRQQGLQFLVRWCASDSMRRLTDLSFHGRRGYLDGFLPLGDHGRQFLRVFPRGLVCHWLAGNVPLLGMLTLAQSIIAGNANLLKAASRSSRVLPMLLDAFRGLAIRTSGGGTLRGDDLLRAIAVVYYDRHDHAAAVQMSEAADVRLAWGGAEAVSEIVNLPKRFGSEDVIFGPKLSYMVVGREALDSERRVRRLARSAATDASVFDQYACASPHTIFVENGGAAASPREFAALLAEEMAKAAVRIPKAPIDEATAAAVENRRLQHQLVGDLWQSADTTWTVLYSDTAGPKLAPPCYSRVVTVSATDDAVSCASYASPDIQTIGLAMTGARRLEFAEKAARLGAERFPDIGRMTDFQSPWDGLLPMERLARWVSLGGPF